MMQRAVLLAWLLAVVLSGCAEGFGSGDNVAQGLVTTGGVSGGGTGGTSGQSASGGGGGSGGSFTGTPCTAGDKVACDCPTGGRGMQSCKFNASSPTMGSFGPCEGCSTTAGSGGNGGDAGDAAGGTGGRSGSGGSGGAGSGGSGGSGGAGSGGSGGSGGSSGAGGSSGSGGSSSGGCPASGCTNSCFPVGVLACCTDFGTCGCTWAPGAYCF